LTIRPSIIRCTNKIYLKELPGKTNTSADAGESHLLYRNDKTRSGKNLLLKRTFPLVMHTPISAGGGAAVGVSIGLALSRSMNADPNRSRNAADIFQQSAIILELLANYVYGADFTLAYWWCLTTNRSYACQYFMSKGHCEFL